MEKQEREELLKKLEEQIMKLDRPQLEQLNRLIDALEAEYKDGERG